MALEDEPVPELRARLEAVMSEEKKKKDESSCVGEMKRLDANGCTKEEMKKKITAEYDVDDAKFENYTKVIAVNRR